jgi:hypothetical protein
MATKPRRAGEFTSTVPYEHERIYAAAIYCSDGRLGDHVDEFLHVGLGLPRYDRVACPGGPVGLAGRLAAYCDTKGMEEQLRFLTQVHEIRKVVLIAHSGCAYYSQRLLLPAEHLEAEQKQDLRNAALAVRTMMSSVEVACYWASVEGPKVVFAPAPV